MLQLLGSVIGLLLIIMCFTRGLKEQARAKKPNMAESSTSNMMKDLTEEDVHLLAKILSMGLVDADPNYLQHLRAFRDLTNR